MQNISLYLEKFKSLGLKDKQSKDLVIEVIKDVCGVSLTSKQVVSKGSEFVCNVTGSQKAVLFLNKEKVIEEVQKRLGGSGEVIGVR